MKTRVHSPSPAALRHLAAALRRGELVAVPTETVYGLAANALDARACRKIFTAKRRPANDPLIVHVSDLAAAEDLAEFNDVARQLAHTFWPGPLTLVLPKRSQVPAIVTSGQPTVALRSPAHRLARQLLRLADVPLAAPSANPFGYVSPTTPAHVLDGLGGRIPHVLDGGACQIGVESTIVDATDPTHLKILRPGAISARDLQAALGRGARRVRVSHLRRAIPSATAAAAPAPGMLEQHYSPRTPMELCSRISRQDAGHGEVGLIFWRKPKRVGRNGAWLTRAGNPAEAARRLYAVLRRMDGGNFMRLICERAPAKAGAWGEAINDRLGRAAAKRRE